MSNDDEFYQQLQGAVTMPDGSIVLPSGSIAGQEEADVPSDDPFERLLAESMAADKETRQQEFQAAYGEAEQEERDERNFSGGFERVLREDARSTAFEAEMQGGERAETWIPQDDDKEDDE